MRRVPVLLVGLLSVVLVTSFALVLLVFRQKNFQLKEVGIRNYEQADRDIAAVLGVAQSWDGSLPHSSYYRITSQKQAGARTIEVIPPTGSTISVTPQNWKQVLAQNAQGKIFVFSPGVYNRFSLMEDGNNFHVMKGNIFLAQPGAIWDGGNVVAKIMDATDRDPAAENVQIIGFTIQNYKDQIQFDKERVATIYGNKGWIIAGNTFQNVSSALNMGWNHRLANGSRIADNKFLYNRWHSANNAGNGADIVFEHNDVVGTAVNTPEALSCLSTGCFCWYGTHKVINDLGSSQQKPAWSMSDGFVLIQNNFFDNNKCSGIWLDVNVYNSIIRGNIVRRSYAGGVTVELSTNTYVVNNYLEDNGSTIPGSGSHGWGTLAYGQVAVFNSPNTYVFGNTMVIKQTAQRSSAMGVICESGRQDDVPGIMGTGKDGGKNVQFKGNTIISTSGTQDIYSGADNSCTFPMPGNFHFDCNRYIVNDKNRLKFRWTTGTYTGYDQFRSLGQETQGFLAASESSQFPAGCLQYSRPAFGLTGLSVPSPSPSRTATATPTPAPTASGGSGVMVPAKIQAEDFNPGGQNVGYYDKTPADLGNSAYRSGEAVDIKDESNGDRLVGYYEKDEWLAYTIQSNGGKFVYTLKAGSIDSNRFVKLSLGSNTLTSVTVPVVPAWGQTKETNPRTITLPAGKITVRLTSVTDFVDVDWFQLKPAVAQDPIPSRPPWWGFLPSNLKGFLESLYITVYIQKQPSDLKYILDGVFPTPTPTPV